jgi:hypothetical protein
MLKLLKDHHITHFVTLLDFYLVKLFVMLVSASCGGKKKVSLNLLSRVIMFFFFFFFFMLRTCASAKKYYFLMVCMVVFYKCSGVLICNHAPLKL